MVKNSIWRLLQCFYPTYPHWRRQSKNKQDNQGWYQQFVMPNLGPKYSYYLAWNSLKIKDAKSALIFLLVWCRACSNTFFLFITSAEETRTISATNLYVLEDSSRNPCQHTPSIDPKITETAPIWSKVQPWDTWNTLFPCIVSGEDSRKTSRTIRDDANNSLCPTWDLNIATIWHEICWKFRLLNLLYFFF